MKKYNVTHPDFTGAAELSYNEGYLVAVSVEDTNMTARQVYDFIRAIPIKQSNLQQYTADSGSEVVNMNWTYTLEDFKHDYPYQRNMHQLPDIWKKLPPSDLVKISRSVKEYKKYCQREAHWYKPKIAAAWLKAKEYLNDWKTM